MGTPELPGLPQSLSPDCGDKDGLYSCSPSWHWWFPIHKTNKPSLPVMGLNRSEKYLWVWVGTARANVFFWEEKLGIFSTVGERDGEHWQEYKPICVVPVSNGGLCLLLALVVWTLTPTSGCLRVGFCYFFPLPKQGVPAGKTHNMLLPWESFWVWWWCPQP